MVFVSLVVPATSIAILQVQKLIPARICMLRDPFAGPLTCPNVWLMMFALVMFGSAGRKPADGSVLFRALLFQIGLFSRLKTPIQNVSRVFWLSETSLVNDASMLKRFVPSRKMNWPNWPGSVGTCR